MFQPRKGGPAIEEAGGHDDEAQPDAVEEGLKDEKSSDDFPEEEVKPPVLEKDAKSANSQIIKYYDDSYDIVLIFCVLGKFSIELLAFVCSIGLLVSTATNSSFSLRAIQGNINQCHILDNYQQQAQGVLDPIT